MVSPFFGYSLTVLESELVLFEFDDNYDDGDDDLTQVVQMVNLQKSCLKQFAKVDQKQ